MKRETVIALVQVLGALLIAIASGLIVGGLTGSVVVGEGAALFVAGVACIVFTIALERAG